tara:strand:+ start:257 stop:880 length:624 start_codon:yes stop_codon:yes gene_type:complete
LCFKRTRDFVKSNPPFYSVVARFDFIDLEEADFSGAKANLGSIEWQKPQGGEGDWEERFADHELLDPYPTITKERKLHGKPLPLVKHSAGYQCPFKSMIVVQEKERGEQMANSTINARDQLEVDNALADGFLPMYLKQKISEVLPRGSSVAGDGRSSMGGGSLMGSSVEKSLSMGSSIWTLNEGKQPSIYENASVIKFLDMVKRGKV